MKTKLENKRLTIYAEGEINSANAGDFDKEVYEILEQNKKGFEALELDFEKVAYISSAGLRVILSLAKRGFALSITNVRSDVYEVLEMTGFTNLLEIHEAPAN